VNTWEHTGCEAGSWICREHSDAFRLPGFQSGKPRLKRGHMEIVREFVACSREM
jgi:hypothetical protein